MTDVLFVVIFIMIGTLMVFYPLGVTVAASRAAYGAHGTIAALATTAFVVAAWWTCPLYTFACSIPLLLMLKVAEQRRRRDTTALPRAIVTTTCRAPQ